MRNRARILVIDASRDVMGYYRRLLEAEGYGMESSTWESAKPAEIERWQPDLIVFDLLVDAEQERQARRLIGQVKASSNLAGIPLLLCAAALVSPDIVASMREQQVVVLFKPLDTWVFSQQIHVLLTRAGGNR